MTVPADLVKLIWNAHHGKETAIDDLNCTWEEHFNKIQISIDRALGL